MSKRFYLLGASLTVIIAVMLLLVFQRPTSKKTDNAINASVEQQRVIDRYSRQLEIIKRKKEFGVELSDRDEDFLVSAIRDSSLPNLQVQAAVHSSSAVYKKLLRPEKVRAALYEAAIGVPDGPGRSIFILNIILVDELGEDILSTEAKESWAKVRKLAWSPDDYLDRAEIEFLKVAMPSQDMDDRMRALRLIVKKDSLKIENIRLVHSLAAKATSKATGKEKELWTLALKIFDKYNPETSE